jgi:hypothetical protein
VREMSGRRTACHFAQANAFAPCDPRHTPADASMQINGRADDADYVMAVPLQRRSRTHTRRASGCIGRRTSTVPINRGGGLREMAGRRTAGHFVLSSKTPLRLRPRRRFPATGRLGVGLRRAVECAEKRRAGGGARSALR